MSNNSAMNLGCRHCRYYQMEGRRWGHCQLLGVPVQGGWATCSHAVPPFAPSGEHSQICRKEQRQEIARSSRLLEANPPPLQV
ncbi:MAG: hypothetical protein RLZZ338_906 [Cyanobacteriota bacterium]|jgi:hypothetical protein